MNVFAIIIYITILFNMQDVNPTITQPIVFSLGSLRYKKNYKQVLPKLCTPQLNSIKKASHYSGRLRQVRNRTTNTKEFTNTNPEDLGSSISITHRSPPRQPLFTQINQASINTAIKKKPYTPLGIIFGSNVSPKTSYASGTVSPSEISIISKAK